MPGRNEPCPCGSGRKYKHCHGSYKRRSAAMENPGVLTDRARDLARRGRLDEALEVLRGLPLTPARLHNQAMLLIQRGHKQDLLKADGLLIQQQRLSPHSAEPRLKRGEIQWRAGKYTEALKLIIAAGKIAPGHAHVEYYLGVALQLTGKPDTAQRAYRRSILKNTRESLNEFEIDIETAIQAYETAAGHYPGSTVQDEHQLVNAEADYTRLQSALHCWQASKPDLAGLSAEKITRYGNAFYNLGCVDMARFNCLKRAGEHFMACLDINPRHLDARCNYLFLLNYDNKVGADEITTAHFEAARELRAQLGPPLIKFANNPDPDKLLRIGYLSSDFRKHSVIYFITPILAAHDRSRFQIHAYYNERKLDQWTREVQSLVDAMHPVALLDDRELQQKILSDGIDILVDLNGYTKGHRAGLFMRRAAPIQVSWLGYPNTSGMDVMDYRIVDPYTDPEGSQGGYSETLIHMPDVFSVYLPEQALPPVAPQTPALDNGFATFGSFNFLPKLNPELLAMWAEILAAVPGSRLLIKNLMLSQAVIIRDLGQAIVEAGMDPARVSLEGRTESMSGHMKFYNGIDLCLDSLPYNGTTTTCDSLIMGVPVLTMAGDSHRSRVTASQLRAVGLHRQLVAADKAEYVKTAIRLASDHMLLNNLRQGIRERLAQSPLMDAKVFTRELEKRYHTIWGKWCKQGS